MIRKFKIKEPFNKLFKININVSVDGVFTCTIPKDIADLFLSHGIKLYPNRRHNLGFYESDTLVGLCNLIKTDIKILCSEKEISRKRVIQYAIEIFCSYAKRPDGDFEPNCAYESRDLEWSNGTIDLNALERKPYGFQVYAKVYERVDYQFCNGKTRVEYLSLNEHGFYNKRMDDPIAWLSSISSDSSGRFNLKEMDYTPERGMFFVNLYKSIFKINEQIKPFLEEKLLEKAIDSNIRLLKM